MRIDLHTHTQNCKKGDGSKRKISPEDYVAKMLEQEVKVCSITNHNKFDKDEFEKIIQLDSDLTIFPGIELDVDCNNERRHVVVICNPNKIDKFYSTFDGDSSRDYDSFSLPYDDFVSKVHSFGFNEIIIIPHFLDKDKGFSIEEKETLFQDLSGYIVMLETSKLRSMGIVNEHEDHLCLIGSDVKDWSKYSCEFIPEIKFAITSFEKFYELANDSKSFVKNVLKGANQNIISIDDGGNNIAIFDDINIIFGEKGSGKTILLKNYIYPQLQDIGKNVFLHEGNNYIKQYENMLKKHEGMVEKDKDKYDTIVRNFTTLMSYSEQKTPDFIKIYTNYRQVHSKNKKAQRIIKTEATFSNNNTDTIESIISEAKKYTSSIERVMAINNAVRKSENHKDRENLDSELLKLSVEIQERVNKKYKNIFIADKTEQFLNALKQTLNKKDIKQSKPNNIGFSKLVAQRLMRCEINQNLTRHLADIQDISTKNIGTLPGKGNVTFETSIVTLSIHDKHKRDSVFDKAKIVRNRKIIEKLANFSFSDFPSINEYFDSHEKGITGTEFADDVVKKSSIIKIKGDDDYTPSDGEKAILSISGLLEGYSYDYYLFDEVERGLGNKYISEYLIPRLKELRNKGKTVVLSTHNANIAVNTLPSQVICCNYSDGNDYYPGNMYSNELVGAKNGNVLSWKEMALTHLEGSSEMFNRRRNIYGI